jgi:phage-related protein
MDMISASFRGEYDSIQRLIPSINAAAVETKALAMTGKTNSDTLTEQEKALATYQLLLEGAGPATGDFARTQDGAANSMRIAQAQIKSAGEQIGAVFLPIVAKVSAMVSEWAQKFSDLDERTKTIIVAVAAAAAALGPLVFVGGKLVSVVSGIIGVVKGLSTAMSFLAANPVMLIIAAVVALVAGLVYAYHNFEGFRNVVDTVFQAVATAAQWLWNTILKPVWDAIYGFIETTLIPAFQSLWTHIQTAWDYIATAVTWAWNTILKPIWDAISWYVQSILIPYFQLLWNVYSTIWNAIAAIVTWAWTTIIQPIWNAIYAYIENVLVPIFQFLWNVVQTVWNGLSSAISMAWGIISGIFEAIKSGIGAVASWFGDRIENIKNVFSGIADAISGPFKTAFNFISDAWNNTIGSLSWSVPDWVPVIGGKEISAPKLPRFASGGMVPGDPGEPMLALLHGGERVLRRTEVDGLPSQPQRSGDIYVTVNKSDADPYEIGRELLWTMKVAG